MPKDGLQLSGRKAIDKLFKGLYKDNEDAFDSADHGTLWTFSACPFEGDAAEAIQQAFPELRYWLKVDGGDGDDFVFLTRDYRKLYIYNNAE